MNQQDREKNWYLFAYERKGNLLYEVRLEYDDKVNDIVKSLKALKVMRMPKNKDDLDGLILYKT